MQVERFWKVDSWSQFVCGDILFSGFECGEHASNEDIAPSRHRHSTSRKIGVNTKRGYNLFDKSNINLLAFLIAQGQSRMA